MSRPSLVPKITTAPERTGLNTNTNTHTPPPSVHTTHTFTEVKSERESTVSVIQAPPPLVSSEPIRSQNRKMKKPHADKDSDEYRQRRERNNLAVKKSRMRSKQKAQDTQQRVNELKEENQRLEAKIKLLSKELSVLKDLFLEHAHNLADNQTPNPNPTGATEDNNNGPQ